MRELMDVAKIQAAYRWQQSENPLVKGCHRWREADLRNRISYTVSTMDSSPLVIIYAGLNDGLTHILPFLEQQRSGSGGATKRENGTVSWKDAVLGRGIPECDLLAIGASAKRIRHLPNERGLALPFRINLTVPVVPDPQSMRQRVSRKDRQRSARQARARGWVVEVGASDADFDFFYDRIYVPTMLRRHGEATRSVTKDMARVCLFRRGLLLFLREGDERVAGLLCRYGKSGTLTLRLIGVNEGADEHYSSGAIMAAYVALLEWAATHDVTQIDLSGCEPFLSKGIFQFKRKLHPLVALPRDHFGDKRLWLEIRRDSAPVRDFLVANPVLRQQGKSDGSDGWEAWYFYDDERPVRTDLRWECPNVSMARAVHLDAFMAGSGLPASRLGAACESV